MGKKRDIFEEYLTSDKQYVDKLPQYWQTFINGHDKGSIHIQYAAWILMEVFTSFDPKMYRRRVGPFEKILKSMYEQVNLSIPTLDANLIVDQDKYDNARNVAFRNLGLAIAPEFKEQVQLIDEIRENLKVIKKKQISAVRDTLSKNHPTYVPVFKVLEHNEDLSS